MNRFLIAVVLAAITAIGTVSGLFAAGTFGGDNPQGAVGLTAQQQTARPWLGVQLVRTPDGLTISFVIADSPAEKAGLKRGDVVKAVNGTTVSDGAALLSAIKDKKVGDAITVSITRGRAAQDVTVTLGAQPEALPFANPIIPELNGIPRDQLFTHLQGGSFQFKDASGNAHTATVDVGTVTSVDTNAKTISVDLNSGGSKQYTISDGMVIRPADLSKFQSGDHVTIMSVDGNLRAITKGNVGLFPFFGGGHRPRGGHKFGGGGRLSAPQDISGPGI